MRMTKTLGRRRGFINRLKTPFFINQNGNHGSDSRRHEELWNMSRSIFSIRSRRTVQVKVLSVIIAVAVAAIIIGSMLAASNSVSGGSGPKPIRGYVKDSLGNPIEGANVTVNVTHGTIKTLYDDTNATGFYSVTFAPENWDIGDQVDVTAKYESYKKTESTTIGDEPILYINVTLDFIIPEFADFALISSIFGVLILFAVFRRRN